MARGKQPTMIVIISTWYTETVKSILKDITPIEPIEGDRKADLIYKFPNDDMYNELDSILDHAKGCMLIVDYHIER